MKTSLIIKDIPRLDRLTSEQMDEIHGGRINLYDYGPLPPPKRWWRGDIQPL